MKNIFTKILLSGIALAAVVSCELDLYPNSSIVYDENESVIKSSSDLVSFENGLHIAFRGRQSSTFSYVDDLMFDGFNAATDFGNNFGPVHRTDADYNAGNSDIETCWGSNFTSITNYNIAIAAAEALVGTDLEADALIMKGEAHFYRAFTYLYLARHFGKAYNPATAANDPSVPKITVFDTQARPKRASQAEIYALIKEDLDAAATLLAEVVPEAGKQPFIRPTIDAVNALYARYYLDVQDYANAAEKAAALVDSGIYKLASTNAEFTDEYINDTGKEPIFQMAASIKEVPNSLYDYTRIRVSNGEEVYAPYFFPSAKLIGAYEDGDLRLKNWFSPNGTAGRFIYLRGSLNTNDQILLFTKFQGNAAYSSDNIPSGSNAIKPFRIGEMYLIAAESYLAAGEANKAAQYLNALQAARGASETPATVENIRNEWFKETVGEGMRGICLKRWGVGFNGRPAQAALTAEGLVETGPNYADRVFDNDDFFLYTWPIPNYELKINPSLVQNEGYTLSN